MGGVVEWWVGCRVIIFVVGELNNIFFVWVLFCGRGSVVENDSQLP